MPRSCNYWAHVPRAELPNKRSQCTATNSSYHPLAETREKPAQQQRTSRVENSLVHFSTYCPKCFMCNSFNSPKRKYYTLNPILRIKNRDLIKVTKQYINRIRKCKLIQSFLKKSCSIHQQPWDVLTDLQCHCKTTLRSQLWTLPYVP